MDRVQVHYLGRGDRLIASGARVGDVVGFWWGFHEDGRDWEQLSFILLDDGLLLAQPVHFPAEQRGWWYCDLVEVDDQGDDLFITDLYIDVLVGPVNTAYRLLDLDELAAATASGHVDISTALDGLRRCQRFLDRRLNRRHDTTTAWPAFPPLQTEPTRWAALPRAWRWESVPAAQPSDGRRTARRFR